MGNVKIFLIENIANMKVRTEVGESANDVGLISNFIVVKAISITMGERIEAYVSYINSSEAAVVLDYIVDKRPMVEMVLFEFDLTS